MQGVDMKNLCLILTAITAATISTAAFAQPQQQPYDAPQPYASPPPPPPPQSYRVGVVERIDVIRRDDDHNIAGTVIGGVVGGLIGHQLGGGRGNTAATVVGAAGGAVAGNQIEKRSHGPNEAFRITVRLDDGGYQTVTQDDIADLRAGDRVRIEGGRVYRT
jgi:outer membrane lipoprotein SlyB